MNQSIASSSSNIFNTSPPGDKCSGAGVAASSFDVIGSIGGDYPLLFHNADSEGGPDEDNLAGNTTVRLGSNSACILAAQSSSSVNQRRSQQTAVIVSPIAQHQTTTDNRDLRSPFDAAASCAASPYTACATAQPYFDSNDTCATSPVLQASSFFPSYYGLPQSLTDFNMLQMCCEPLFRDISSPLAETSPTAESLYGFANRLHPVTPAVTTQRLQVIELSGCAHPHQSAMPHSYPQARNGYMASTVARPNSAAAKRGGRRPKEYEEYDHAALSEEERDKRNKRRLRNKEAAARCRQRRLDLMGSLQNQVDQLKEEKKMKDSKIAELQILKNELLAVVREHQCVLPESLRQSLDVDMSSTQQYMPRGGVGVMVPAEMAPFSHTDQPSSQTVLGRKRQASELIPELRQPPQPVAISSSSGPLPLSTAAQPNILSRAQIKQEPTLYDVNGRDTQEEEMKRPTSLSFSEGVAATTASYGALSSSGVSITTPSNLPVTGGSEFGAVNLLDGPTGLTPCHPPQATTFSLSSVSTTPLGEGRSFESL
ncbi:unnamed protein product [Toxocara canis]|uniref:BZIP domain-containing protein n=1 Tax=Toxocara canis TaxID=6265 RepID=A0A183TVR3_TOXCA|nr:unnamed protein product [Toxocara canis]